MLLRTQMYPFSQETAQSVSWLFFAVSQVFAGSTGGRLVKGTAPNCQPTKNFRLTIEGICGILFQKYNEEEFIMEHTTRAPSMRGLSVRDMVLCSLFAALMAVCAWLTIPGEVPFTLQTFGLFATLVLLGGKRGTIAIALYLILGAVGLPVFSGFRGGFGWSWVRACTTRPEPAGSCWCTCKRPVPSPWAWCWPNASSPFFCRMRQSWSWRGFSPTVWLVLSFKKLLLFA